MTKTDKKSLGDQIIDIFLDHPNCSKAMSDDRESFEAAIEALGIGMPASQFLVGEGELSQNTLMNKQAFLADRTGMRKPEWLEKFEEKLDEGEEVLYYEWYFGPLAARGTFFAVNQLGMVTKQEMIWIS